MNALKTYDAASKIRAGAAIFINQAGAMGFEMTEDEAHGVSIILHEIADELDPATEPEGGAS